MKAPDNSMPARPANWRMEQHAAGERRAKGIPDHPNWGDEFPSKPGWYRNLAKVTSSPMIGRCDVVYDGRIRSNTLASTWGWKDNSLTAFRPLEGWKVNPKT